MLFGDPAMRPADESLHIGNDAMDPGEEFPGRLRLTMATPGTDESLRPPHRLQVLGTGLLGGKRFLKLQQTPLAVPFHPRGHPDSEDRGACELSR